MTREEILSKAKECVCGQREQDYGSPESNFELIADLWNAYLYSTEDGAGLITPTDVAMMMALLKIARIRNGGGTGDSFVDLAGYAACGGELNSLSKDVFFTKKTGLFSDAFEKDNCAGHFCDNCKWEYEVSNGKHCNTCCHNDTSSTESHWESAPKECNNCLFKDKSENDYPCNKCILNGHDENKWVSDERCKDIRGKE